MKPLKQLGMPDEGSRTRKEKGTDVKRRIEGGGRRLYRQVCKMGMGGGGAGGSTQSEQDAVTVKPLK